MVFRKLRSSFWFWVFANTLKKNFFESRYGFGRASEWGIYVLSTEGQQQKWFERWLSTTPFAPDSKQAKRGHGSAEKNRRCYRYMKQCIMRINKERGAVEAITAQFQSAAFQCPDSNKKGDCVLSLIQLSQYHGGGTSFLLTLSYKRSAVWIQLDLFL
jgi:hypothetical protein